MNEAIYVALGLLVGGGLGWLIGGSRRGGTVQGQLVALLRSLRAGRLPAPEETFQGELPVLKEIRSLLSTRWAPKEETDDVQGPVLERLALYLQSRVEEPLSQALEGEEEELREWVASVLGAVEDVRFFLEGPSLKEDPEPHNLVDLVSEVTGEFADEFTIRVRVEGSPGPLRARVAPEPLKDALFLVLHNAGEFGGGDEVEMTFRKTEDTVRLVIRDRGPGFSAEALIRAVDPFYSTSPDGLGLGIPYARQVVKAQGGEMVVRNAEEGGAEVEIVLPAAE